MAVVTMLWCSVAAAQSLLYDMEGMPPSGFGTKRLSAADNHSGHDRRDRGQYQFDEVLCSK